MSSVSPARSKSNRKSKAASSSSQVPESEFEGLPRLCLCLAEPRSKVLSITDLFSFQAMDIWPGEITDFPYDDDSPRNARLCVGPYDVELPVPDKIILPKDLTNEIWRAGWKWTNHHSPYDVRLKMGKMLVDLRFITDDRKRREWRELHAAEIREVWPDAWMRRLWERTPYPELLNFGDGNSDLIVQLDKIYEEPRAKFKAADDAERAAIARACNPSGSQTDLDFGAMMEAGVVRVLGAIDLADQTPLEGQPDKLVRWCRDESDRTGAPPWDRIAELLGSVGISLMESLSGFESDLWKGVAHTPAQRHLRFAHGIQYSLRGKCLYTLAEVANVVAACAILSVLRRLKAEDARGGLEEFLAGLNDAERGDAPVAESVEADCDDESLDSSPGNISWTEPFKKKVRDLLKQGKGYKAIAQELGVTRDAIRRGIERHNLRQ